MDALHNFLLYFVMIQTVVWLTRITTSFSQSNCYAPKETICKRYLPFIENGDLANGILFIMLSSFSLDKAESTPPSVHYYITHLLPTCCRNIYRKNIFEAIKSTIKTLFPPERGLFCYHLQIYRLEVLLPFDRRWFIFSIYPFLTSSSIARFTVDTLHLFSRAMVLWDW